jgi:hypothetical protein
VRSGSPVAATVVRVDWQRPDPLLADSVQQALREKRKSPELLLVGYFVTAAGADKDMVFRICDSASSCYRDLRSIDEPPQ